MDMQGTPIGSTNQGMKNTSDTAAKFASIKESPGAIASDSLAANSPTFQRSNPTEPIAIEGGKSNLANTDTSGTTTLPPADSTSAREASLEDQDVRYPEGTDGVPKFAGSHNSDGTYSGGSTQAQDEIRRSQRESIRQFKIGNSTTGSGKPTSGFESTSSDAEHLKPTEDNTINPGRMISSESNSSSSPVPADPAPSYVTNLTTPNTGKPKGKNLTEGGFDDDDGRNKASYTADVGSKDDPGRTAQQGFQKLNAATAGSNARPQEQEVSGEGTYDALGAENEA